MTITIPGGQLHALAPESARHTRRSCAQSWVKTVVQHFDSPLEIPVVALSTDKRHRPGSLKIRRGHSSDSPATALQQITKRSEPGALRAGRPSTPTGETALKSGWVAP